MKHKQLLAQILNNHNYYFEPNGLNFYGMRHINKIISCNPQQDSGKICEKKQTSKCILLDSYYPPICSLFTSWTALTFNRHSGLSCIIYFFPITTPWVIQVYSETLNEIFARIYPSYNLVPKDSSLLDVE